VKNHLFKFFGVSFAFHVLPPVIVIFILPDFETRLQFH
jgi:hypothetical protein